jgi:hypothetical protein
MPDLTKRQQEALIWLSSVGKAGPKTLRRHGFSARTMEALVDSGLVSRSYAGGGIYHWPIYRPVKQEADDA